MKNPVLFSTHFGVNTDKLNKYGLLDPILNYDTKLFIEPILLQGSQNTVVKQNGIKTFHSFFGNIIRLLDASKTVGDTPWRNAKRLFSLDERREICLGYGNENVSGSRRDSKLQERLLTTAKEIIELGIRDPELFSLLGLLEEGVGADTIGDMTANAIFPSLVEITKDFCQNANVPLDQHNMSSQTYMLPTNIFDTRKSPILLVPLDILRDLPLAESRDDVSRVTSENEEIRNRVNIMIGDIAKATIKKRKKVIKSYALSGETQFRTLLAEVMQLSDKSYDSEFDPEGHLLFRRALTSIATEYPLALDPKDNNQKELRDTVDKIINHFRHLVEDCGLFELLWYGSKPRRERAAQRLFFGIADSYCKSNDVDISPESDHGTGPVDFKFSTGYRGRVLVEVKLSNGKVVHGYNTQLETYKKSASTEEGIFLVMDVGGMGKKLETIFEIQRQTRLSSDRASDIEIIDAIPKPSASKR